MKMNIKKITVFAVIALFAFGGLGMMTFGGKGNGEKMTNNAVTSNQQGETYDEMMARMHPDQQKSSTQTTSSSSGETYDEMMARMHPDQQKSSSSAVDDLNAGMDTISLSGAVGESAPDFTLINQDGSEFTLSDYENKTVVLFFNEGAMCYPACWDQIASLGEDERFNNNETISASIVIDGKEKWDKIIKSQPKYGAGIMLFDTSKSVSQAYDVLDAPSSMHKGSNPGHTYIIIKEGIISYVLDDAKMALNNDALALKL